MRLRNTTWALGLVTLFLSGSWAVGNDREPVGTPSSTESPRFTFLQISDVHVGHALNRPVHKRLAAAIELANALKSSFVIDTGDMTTHPVYEANEENLAEFAEYKSYAASLIMPLYNVPGNHDIGYLDGGNDVRRDGKRWADGKRLRAWYCRNMGPLDQAFVVGGVSFLLINNNPLKSKSPGYISDDQFQWIEEKLKTSERAFIFCHVQLLENGRGTPWGVSAQGLVGLCRQYRVAAVAYGHYHQAHVKAVDGTQYIMCPDLKQPDHQAIYQYRIFSEHFELWKYDVFSKKGARVGAYSMPADGSRKPAPKRTTGPAMPATQQSATIGF
jgi:3',5'-cyclic AMP phosphodiesterase CpdA